MCKQSVNKLDIRVYYEDTDAGGVVYYANYLKFFERGRSEWVRTIGVSQADLLEQNIAFVVRRVEMDNIAPARFEQIITVQTALTELKRASMVFTQTITHNNKTLVSAIVKVACVDLGTMKPRAIPAELSKELSSGT
jgi:acyl-CoA thioester hydrolase